MIARIWPKDKKKKKSAGERSNSTNASSSKATPTPNKLGDRLKAFDRPSLPSDESSSFSNRTQRTDNTTSARRVFTSSSSSQFGKLPTVPDISKQEKSLSDVDEKAMDSATKSINKNTLKKLSSFQKLWRRRKMNSKKEQCSKIEAPDSPTATESSTSASSSSITSLVKDIKSCIGIGNYYTLDDFEQKRVDCNEVDMNKWESYLSPDEFAKHFDGVSKAEFYDQPKWKQDKQKRKVRVAF